MGLKEGVTNHPIDEGHKDARGRDGLGGDFVYAYTVMFTNGLYAMLSNGSLIRIPADVPYDRMHYNPPLSPIGRSVIRPAVAKQRRTSTHCISLKRFASAGDVGIFARRGSVPSCSVTDGATDLDCRPLENEKRYVGHRICDRGEREHGRNWNARRGLQELCHRRRVLWALANHRPQVLLQHFGLY